jgi:hypothetical protein
MIRLLGAAASAALLSIVPAQSQVLPPIPNANHFLCYPVRPATFAARGADLRDQFGDWHVKVIGITRLCVPTEKRLINVDKPQVYPIVDKAYHLVCYKIQLGTVERARRLALIHDQFSGARVELALPNELCLPAGKLKLGPDTK